MTRVEESHVPAREALEPFEDAYQLFRSACARHGFE
jgi:hypothetical protein